MNYIKTGFRLSDIGYIGAMTGKLEKVFIAGSAERPFPNESIESISEEQLSRMLVTKGEGLCLDTLRNLGLPYRQSGKRIDYDHDNVIRWTGGLRKILESTVFRVEDSLPLIKSKRLTRLQDEDGQKCFHLDNLECSHSLKIVSFDNYFLIKGSITNYCKGEADPKIKSLCIRKNQLWWKHLSPGVINSFCGELSYLLNIDSYDIENATGLLLDLSKTPSKGSVPYGTEPRVSLLTPFQTDSTIVSGGFRALVREYAYK